MRSPVWTLEEILAYEETGNWFFGIVRDEDGLHLSEIFPGLGYTLKVYWLDWPRALYDVLREAA